jgi:hypothetical protein
MPVVVMWSEILMIKIRLSNSVSNNSHSALKLKFTDSIMKKDGLMTFEIILELCRILRNT